MSINTPNNSNTSTANTIIGNLQAMPQRGKYMTFASLGMLLLFMLISALDTRNEAIAGPGSFVERIIPILLLFGAFICSAVNLLLSLFGGQGREQGQLNYVQLGLNVLVLLIVTPLILSNPGQIFALVVLVAGVCALIGMIWLIVAGFRVSVLWGLICLFVPFGFIAFAVVHWSDAKRPFLFASIGFVVFLVLFPLVMMLAR